MASLDNTKCIICGTPVGPGVRFCSRFCKLTAKNDKLLSKLKAKTEKAKPNKEASTSKPTSKKKVK